MQFVLMGPAAVFDKSFLQSLSLDESVWFDNYFAPIITPLFFVETLADLEKSVKEGRRPEDEVGIIADKTPEVNGMPNVHHVALCESELNGFKIPFQGRPVISGGKRAVIDGKKGIVFDTMPEAQALQRWRNREFLEVERLYAQQWRAALAEPVNLPGEDYLKWYRTGLSDLKNIEQVRVFAKQVIADVRSSSYDRLKFVFDVIGIRDHLSALNIKYQKSGTPSLLEYAPFTAHVLEVEVFFRFACDRGFISRVRASNRVDIAYLHYLPFCHVFVSGDRLHRSTVPLFLRDYQNFVDAVDLKADLARINARYLDLPETEREKGIFSFAPKPPTDGDFLTARLWDKCMLPRWRDRSPVLEKSNLETRQDFFARMKKMEAAVKSGQSVPEFGLDEADSVQIKKMLRKRKGSWYQLPKDLEG